MKITIEINDDLLIRIQELAREEKTSVDALAEAGLRRVLEVQETKQAKLKWEPLVCFRGSGLTDEFKNASWEEILDESYRGRGT